MPATTPAAIATRQGTRIPRRRYFFGTEPPAYHSPVVIGELHDDADDETQIPTWSTQGFPSFVQTVPRTADESGVRIDRFTVQLLPTFPVDPPAVARVDAFPGAAWVGWRSAVPSDVAAVFSTMPLATTGSAWQNLRQALAPLQAAASVIRELITDRSDAAVLETRQVEHAGLAAVGWLERVLRLSRPVVLRMANVPESTFYAWQKRPASSVRMPTVERLLRLQAEIGLLLQARGLDYLRAWILANDRLERLQGTDELFASVWSEAAREDRGVEIRGRRRMRLDDYAAYDLVSGESSALSSPAAGARQYLGDDD